MAGNRKSRARRRNEQRRKANASRVSAAAAVKEPEVAQLERARHQTQLEFLLGRSAISEAQYRAGDRLYRLWRASGSEPTIVGSYEPDVIWGAGEMSEAKCLARHEVTVALQRVGPILSPVLVHVCLLDGRLRDWEELAGKKPGDGVALLRAALDGLALVTRRQRTEARLEKAS